MSKPRTNKPDGRKYAVLKSLAIACALLTGVVPTAIFFVPVLIWGTGPAPPMAVPAEIVLALVAGCGFLTIASRLGRAADRRR